MSRKVPFECTESPENGGKVCAIGSTCEERKLCSDNTKGCEYAVDVTLFAISEEIAKAKVGKHMAYRDNDGKVYRGDKGSKLTRSKLESDKDQEDR